MDFLASEEVYQNDAKNAEFKAQFLLEDSVKAKHNFDVLTFDLECADANLAKSYQDQEQMKVIIDHHLAVAINGDQEKPVDRNLFDQLLRRCEQAKEEVQVLSTQLAESE
eukprot:10881024-Heterocapsa_arctica.AAC.1